jgi:hypothetical protein
MTAQTRPSLAKKQTRASKQARDEGLDRGIAFTDTDGTRLAVRVGDIRGTHDAQLRAEVGMDFEGLLASLQRSQGLDLLAAVVWFGRLVNSHNTAETYPEILERFTYRDVVELDAGDPREDEARPEA